MHVPGHKSGAVWHAGDSHDQEAGSAGALVDRLAGILPYDLTELPGLDDLHAPSGAIAEAETLAAACFGARETAFLVGGSTVGNLAAVLALVAPGDLVLVDRNAHKSIWHALQLAEARVVLLDTVVVDGVPFGPDPAQVIATMSAHPETKAVFLTRPTYYGTAIALKEIITHAQNLNIPVCVDEAHGAHYGLHAALPPSALALGADLVVQSTHKMLPALTMSAMLHMQGDRIPAARVRQLLRMLQSSSPSYPLLAGLDLARRYAATQAERDIAESLTLLNQTAEALGWALGADAFKWVITDPTGSRTGYELYETLQAAGFYPELADMRHVVLYHGLKVDAAILNKLVAVLSQMDVTLVAPRPESASPRTVAAAQVVTAFSRSQLAQPTRIVPVHEAVGERVAEMVIPYPPGVALLIPGERITAEVIATLAQLREAGAHVQGVADRTLRTIQIYD
jgi:arginine/lysine/ornithine decarboxylase